MATRASTVARLLHHAFERRAQQIPGALRKRVRERRPSGRDPRLDSVGDRVVAGHRRDAARRAHRELGIENRDLHRRRRIAARHLHMRRGIGDDGIALRLAPGAGGRRNADHRQQRCVRLAVSTVVGHRAAVGQQEVDALGAVERAAAAEPDDRVDPERRGKGAAGLDHRGIGILAEVVVREWRSIPAASSAASAGGRRSRPGPLRHRRPGACAETPAPLRQLADARMAPAPKTTRVRG